MQEPIIILGISRSGTSLISGIFCLHGVFFGQCREADENNPKGYFENKKISDIKRQTKSHHVYGRKEIYDILIEDGYSGGLWGVKFLPDSINMWENFNPTFICCRRGLQQNYKSYSRFFDTSKPKFTSYYHKMHNTMDKVSDFDINTKDVVNGDYSSLKEAINSIGLSFDEELTNNFIEKDYWHFD